MSKRKQQDALESQIASAADFLNTCLRESNLSHDQVGVEDLRPGIDALYLRFIRTKVEFDALAAQVETLREALRTCIPWIAQSPRGAAQEALAIACSLVGSDPFDWSRHSDVLGARMKHLGMPERRKEGAKP